MIQQSQFSERWATDPNNKNMFKQSLGVMAVGIEMGVSIFIGVFGGKWLDAHFETEPAFFWIGTVVGIGAAAKAVVDATRTVQKELNKTEPEQHESEDTKKN